MNSLESIQYLPSEGGERETAILAAVINPTTPVWVAEDHLDELEALADTAGADVVGRITQARKSPSAANYIGKGKVTELADMAKSNGANLLIFDADLTPVQIRNLEEKTKLKVIDRSGLILDIFARRARTAEAKVQVELAQLQYYLPRLTKMWSHLLGQQGGIGFRGPGETQLEVDRRIVQTRITHLRKKLKKITQQRETRRSSRRNTPTAALVGYTNVGKSTLLNALSGTEDAFVENRLFATLDPKWRQVVTEAGKQLLLIDTVGFIRKLPHHLVASFRSTLEEAQAADVIVHVADLSHPLYEDQIKQTEEVLKDLDLEKKQTLLVFNKIDRLDSPATLEKARQDHPGALFVSAIKGLRIWELKEELETRLFVTKSSVDLEVTPEQLQLLSQLGSQITLQNKEWHEGVIKLTLSGPKPDVDN
ncbi:MAG TPA: GTPase HflX, partial [Bacteroidetes bacterium]|nr:GTPase HflX [Bacteroidota bacterium]HEX04380.1 GTPase HflX [Bacteroidota bacterium]